MQDILLTFAAAEGSKDNSLFGALGIDVRILILQIVAFAILVWLLGKYVYPILLRAIDKREAAIADSVNAAAEAEAKAEESQTEIAKMLKDARKEAAEIVDIAHKDAAAQVKDAEDKANKRAEQIVADARQQLDRDIVKARQQLKSDTAELVSLATEKIIREKIDTKKDKDLIETTLKEAA